MKTEIVNMTPKLAVQLLAKNKNIRRMRPAHVEYLATAIIQGQFETTHQGIALDPDGNLTDGQHRLAAIVKANLPVKLMVTTGVVARNLDVGFNRTAADILGESRFVTGACRLMIHALVNSSRPQVHEIELTIDALREEITILSEMKSLGGRARVTASPIVAAAILRLNKHAGTSAHAVASQLIRSLTHGELNGAQPVVLAFYKQLMERQTYGGSSQIELFARSWTAFDPTNTSRTKLQVSNQGLILKDARDAFHKATADNFSA